MCAARLTSRFITNETLLQAWFVLSNADDRDLRQPLLRIVRNRFPMLLDHVEGGAEALRECLGAEVFDSLLGELEAGEQNASSVLADNLSQDNLNFIDVTMPT